MHTEKANSIPTTEPRELALLFACARTDANVTAHPELLQDIDWSKFIGLTKAHHVMPLTYKALVKLSIPQMDDGTRQILRQGFQYNTQRCLFLLAQLTRLISVFEEKKIQIVPFKGPVLSLAAYKDVAARQCGDLDVLVHPSDVPAARKLLLDLGHKMVFPTSTPKEAAYLQSMSAAEEQQYIRSHSEYHLIRPSDGLNIDLHWRLNPPELTVDFDEEAMWGRLQTITAAGKQIYQLGPADQLLLLAFNGAKDCWKRLDRICDIAELLRSHPDVDWGEALDYARDIGVERMVLLGLALAQEVLDAPLTADMAAAIRRDSVVHALVPSVRRELASPIDLLDLQGRFAPTLLQLKLRERWRDRVRYCFAHLNPTVGDWVAFPLPHSLSFLYYVLRPVRLAMRSIR